MIGKLTGTYAGTADGGVLLIDVGGVGYCVRTPFSTIATAEGLSGALSLFIHTAVRDDAIDLYGFSSEQELAFFKQLISVSGVGPKTALGILNVADIDNLKRSIAGGDATVLNKVFGIGKKSAERIVVELRDKLAHETGEVPGLGGDGEVIEALMALGYAAAEARAALGDVTRTGGADSVAGRVSAALKVLGRARNTA